MCHTFCAVRAKGTSHTATDMVEVFPKTAASPTRWSKKQHRAVTNGDYVPGAYVDLPFTHSHELRSELLLDDAQPKGWEIVWPLGEVKQKIQMWESDTKVSNDNAPIGSAIKQLSHLVDLAQRNGGTHIKLSV